MRAGDKESRSWLELRKQLTESRLSRREVAKMGLLLSGTTLLGVGGRQARAQAVPLYPPSPFTKPWMQQLPIPESWGESDEIADRPDPRDHQFYWRVGCDRVYRVRVEEKDHEFHKDLPKSSIFGYGGTYPGKTIDARYGEPFALDIENRLPDLDEHKGFGLPSITSHLHNAHTAPESDGGPWDWTDPGGIRYQHYCMMRAGFSDPNRDQPGYPGYIPPEWQDAHGGDMRESLTSLFLHDHRPEFTAANVYRGLSAFCRFFDERETGYDTGDEEDTTSPNAWRLPSGKYDVPLVLEDKRFDADGMLFFDQFAVDGFLGDKFTVNGKIQPIFKVKRRKYRFRILNPGPSRFYNLLLRHNGVSKTFVQITENGNFLEKPETVKSLQLWVAERADIIIDFSQFYPGDQVFLSNTLLMRANGRGAKKINELNPDRNANRLLKFVVTSDVARDESRIPSVFRPFAPLPTNTAGLPRRTWVLGRSSGMWTINGKTWDPDIDHLPKNLLKPQNPVVRGSSEVWVMKSENDGWDHPMHIHHEEGQILTFNGNVPTRRARSDVYRLGDNGAAEMEVLMHFRDFPDSESALAAPGRYVLHCHNTVHEDHAMMATWNIVPEPPQQS
jgi:FtsP/CotA-like multicopper oxidase with cupredoxin domain